MKTQYNKYKKRQNSIENKLSKLELKYPDIKLNNLDFLRDMKQYSDLSKELIYANVNAKCCKSNNINERCEDCNCWKLTAKNCM